MLKARLVAAEEMLLSCPRLKEGTREDMEVEGLQGDRGLVLAALLCTKAHLVCVGDTKTMMLKALARDAQLASFMSIPEEQPQLCASGGQRERWRAGTCGPTFAFRP
jgi:hypothetical protein